MTISKEPDKNSDIKEIIDFVLDYGRDGDLPNMQFDRRGSGDIAYEAAMRLRNDRLPKAEVKLSIELTRIEANAIMVMLDNEMENHFSEGVDWTNLELDAYRMLAFQKFKTWYKENV